MYTETLLGPYPKLSHQKDMCTSVFIVALLTINKEINSRETDKEVWITDTKAFSFTEKRLHHLQKMSQLEIIMLSELSEGNSCFLPSVGPRVYTCVRSYTHLRQEVEEKLGNWRMEGWQGNGQNTLKLHFFY